MSEISATPGTTGRGMTSKRVAGHDWTSGDIGELAEVVVEQMEGAPAVLSVHDVESAERRLASMAELRRAALLILSSPGARLVEQVEHDRAFAVHVARIHHRLRGYPEELQGLSELLDCAQARMVVALSARTDLDQIIEEAAGGDLA